MKHTRLMAEHVDIHSLGLLSARGVDVGLGHLCVVSTGGVEGLVALQRQGLAHDGAAAAEKLQVGHGASHGGRVVGCRRGRQGAQSGWRCLFQEGADGL